MLGHNKPIFDNVVEENLTRGLLLTIKDAMITATRDPRCERRHLRVLAEIIDCLNFKTAMAWPGRKKLTQLTGDALRPAGYSEATIAKTVAELIAWGYLVADRRTPQSGGRTLSHYTIQRPSIADLQDEIASWVQRQREATAKRPFPSNGKRPLSMNLAVNGVEPPPVADCGEEHPLFIDAPNGERPLIDEWPLSMRSDGERGIPADGEPGVPTVTRKRTSNNNTTGAAKHAAPGTGSSTSRGSRLADDWTIPDDWRAWTHSEFRVTDRQVQLEADKFRDFWQAKPGQGGTKLDWRKTWCNWCRTAFAQCHAPQTYGQASPGADSEREAYLAQLRAAGSIDP